MRRCGRKWRATRAGCAPAGASGRWCPSSSRRCTSKFRSSSLSSLHVECELAVVRKVGVICQAGNLKRTHWDFSRGKKLGGIHPLLLEGGGDDALDARHGPGGSVDGAQVNGLSESEIIGIKET